MRALRPLLTGIVAFATTVLAIAAQAGATGATPLA